MAFGRQFTPMSGLRLNRVGLATNPAAAPVVARPIEAVVNASVAPTRQARLFPQSRLDEARVLNPALFERLRPIRVLPVPQDRPGCPAGGEHDHTGSGNYTLASNRAGLPGQSNWRWCRKCQGLAFGGNPVSVCPKGGTHDLSQSADYILLANVPAPAGHQPNWRWCNRCQGLAFAGANTPGLCPAGGLHDHAGSGDYVLPLDNGNAEGQPEWRWCNKCQGLAYAGGATGATREELALPVASADPIDAGALFEAATGPDRLYLPHYALSRRVVSGSEQYEIRMAPGSDGQWTLRVVLAKTRPPSIAADVAATELPHDLLLQLNYRLVMSDGGSTTKSLDFTEVGESDDHASVIALMHFASPAERDQALAAITTSNSGCGIVATRSVRVAVPIVGAAGRFRPVTRGLAQVIDPDPLFLNAQLHPYLFDGAIPQGGGPGLVTKQLQFEGQFHDYWEDAVDPTRIYYLPDSFRLARRDKPSPFTPMMSVRVTAGVTPDADPMIDFSFAATPWSDTRRLQAAQREFAKALPAAIDAPPATEKHHGGLGGLLGSVLGGILTANGGADSPLGGVGNALAGLLGVKSDDALAARIRMEPVPVEKASFWLTLPGTGGGGLVERPAAQIDVRTALVVSETLPMADFQTVYDALVNGAVAIMKGEIRCDFGGGVTGKIPFDARFDQMNGELVEVVVADGDKPGVYVATLTNAVESPVLVNAVDASLMVGGLEVAGAEAFDKPLPCTLAPGEAMTVTVSPKIALPSPLPPGVTVQPLLDLSGIKPVLDSARLWDSILDADTAAEARRTVRVKLFPGMFDAPSGNAADKAFAIIVQFEDGPSVELTPDKPEGEVKLKGSITDIVLRRPGAGGYRYKCQIIRRAARINDADWRPETTDLLVPQLPEG